MEVAGHPGGLGRAGCVQPGKCLSPAANSWQEELVEGAFLELQSISEGGGIVGDAGVEESLIRYMLQLS